MAAINHGGTFYRLIKVRSLVTAAKQTSWPCILRASKSCRSHSQLKAFRSAIASLKLKRKANCIRAGSFSPFPSCHASGTPDGSSTASTHNPYKEVILSRRPFNEGVKGCTRPPPTPLRTCSPSHDPALKNNRLPSGTRSEQSLFL